MDQGFEIDLEEADKAARYPGGSLAQAAELLRAPLSSLIINETFVQPGKLDEADRLMTTYPAWCAAIGQRLEQGCEVLDANAAALREIIALYRRVDGQG
ncbi:hypothetical protein [Actinocrispum wychmicini]|uniref:Uncharacterized protein n=1 Tax=Actinocrispum wychmicini TaxID=1213861 RepID=A0A4V2S6T2_9PSEU|nr:hypothetical protein [Actinocrispum wychmicini]TCO57270.1 hypothetical protein EV192_106747 [Actinocrispum wychmicini]